MVQLRVDKSRIYSGLFVGLAFLAFTALTVKFFAPDVASNADTINQIVGPYTMSMSNDDSVSLNITPTDSQAIYTATNELSLTNSCDAGATITITTASGSLNSLVRSGLDSLNKEITATTSSNSLSDNSWGYSIDGGTTYHAVPKLGDTAATVYTSDNSQITTLSIPVVFGVKTDSNLPSGAYTNDVVYTMAPNPGCLVYTVTWDLDGGVAAEGATYPTSLAWGETVDLTGLTPTREGYTFNGWSNGSSTFTGNETEADVNPNDAKSVTVKPEWNLLHTEWMNEYTGEVQTLTIPKTGTYKLEVYGAAGGNGTAGNGGLGGYSYGNAVLQSGTVLNVVVGEAGRAPVGRERIGSYNGGGITKAGQNCQTGGGATHIAKKDADGTYTELVSYTNASTASNYVYIVAGGGGAGGIYQSSAGQVLQQRGNGGAGGGTTGGAGGAVRMTDGGYYYSAYGGGGGNQTSGGARGSSYDNGYDCANGTAGVFGQGGGYASVNYYGPTGGGGWYGGGAGGCRSNYYAGGAAGGGSGYLNTSLGLSGGAMSNGVRSGNGQAKITYLGN